MFLSFCNYFQIYFHYYYYYYYYYYFFFFFLTHKSKSGLKVYIIQKTNRVTSSNLTLSANHSHAFKKLASFLLGSLHSNKYNFLTAISSFDLLNSTNQHVRQR